MKILANLLNTYNLLKKWNLVEPKILDSEKILVTRSYSQDWFLQDCVTLIKMEVNNEPSICLVSLHLRTNEARSEAFRFHCEGKDIWCVRISEWTRTCLAMLQDDISKLMFNNFEESVIVCARSDDSEDDSDLNIFKNDSDIKNALFLEDISLIDSVIMKIKNDETTVCKNIIDVNRIDFLESTLETGMSWFGFKCKNKSQNISIIKYIGPATANIFRYIDNNCIAYFVVKDKKEIKNDINELNIVYEMPDKSIRDAISKLRLEQLYLVGIRERISDLKNIKSKISDKILKLYSELESYIIGPNEFLKHSKWQKNRVEMKIIKSKGQRSVGKLTHFSPQSLLGKVPEKI